MESPRTDVGPTTILIIEDHPIFRKALEDYIKTKPDLFQVVASVASAEAGLEMVHEKAPDIALLDLSLPATKANIGEDSIDKGLELISQIRKDSPETKVVVLTAFRKSDVVFRAIKAGAATYLLKDNVAGQQLLQCLAQVRDGEPPIDAHIARQLCDYFEEQPAANGIIREKLTPRETEVLKLISEGLPNSDIAKRLVISHKTVKKHVSNILAKLQLQNRMELSYYYRATYLPRQEHAPNQSVTTYGPVNLYAGPTPQY